MDKHLKPGDAELTVAELGTTGISCTCSFVLGQPDEQPEELSETIALGAKLKLLGTETVQFHRLRMWPPAPITRSPLPVEFDLDSLRIEYPFPQVPPEHVEAIREDDAFFSGYFVPATTAGTSAQLAQVEMFFHHAVSLAPITVAALGQLTRGALVRGFYDALAVTGPLRREQLSWDPSQPPHDNWRIMRPLFTTLIALAALGDDDRSIVAGLFSYEEWRLYVVAGLAPLEPVAAGGNNWSALQVPLDVAQAIERLRAGEELTSDLLEPRVLLLARKPSGGFEPYELCPRSPRNRRRQAESKMSPCAPREPDSSQSSDSSSLPFPVPSPRRPPRLQPGRQRRRERRSRWRRTPGRRSSG